jgi:hypothetical protein
VTINHVKLPMRRTLVGMHERENGILRRDTLVEELEPPMPPGWVGQGLAGKRADRCSRRGADPSDT